MTPAAAQASTSRASGGDSTLETVGLRPARIAHGARPHAHVAPGHRAPGTLASLGALASWRDWATSRSALSQTSASSSR